MSFLGPFDVAWYQPMWQNGVMSEGPLIGAFNASLARIKAIDDELGQLEAKRTELLQELWCC